MLPIFASHFFGSFLGGFLKILKGVFKNNYYLIIVTNYQYNYIHVTEISDHLHFSPPSKSFI